MTRRNRRKLLHAMDQAIEIAAFMICSVAAFGAICFAAFGMYIN